MRLLVRSAVRGRPVELWARCLQLLAVLAMPGNSPRSALVSARIAPPGASLPPPGPAPVTTAALDFTPVAGLRGALPVLLAATVWFLSAGFLGVCPAPMGSTVSEEWPRRRLAGLRWWIALKAPTKMSQASSLPASVRSVPRTSSVRPLCSKAPALLGRCLRPGARVSSSVCANRASLAAIPGL